MILHVACIYVHTYTVYVVCDSAPSFCSLGDHLVDVTEACSCQASCYRMDYFVSYFDYIFDSPNGTKVIAKNEKVFRQQRQLV